MTKIVVVEAIDGKIVVDQSGVDKIVVKQSGVIIREGGSSTLGGLLDVDIPNPQDQEVLTYNATSGLWEADPGASGGVTTFLALDDTPTDYTGEATKVLAVNSSEDGIEFVAAPNSAEWGSITGTLSDQTDLQAELDLKENAFSKNTAFNKNFGTLAGTVTEGDDSRLSDDRDPNPHTHVEADITDLDKYTQTEVDTLLTGKANTVHTHTKAQITDFDDADYATAAQGAKADTALQDITSESIGDLSDVDLTGLGPNKILEYNGAIFSLIDTPTGGGSGAVDSVFGRTGSVIALSGDYAAFYATTAQGAKADSATQPGDNNSTLTNDAGYITLAEVPADSVVSVNSKTGIVVINKTDVGLGNVDNTSDGDKPISTATQTALDLKEDAFSKNTAFNKDFGSAVDTVTEGNDPRLSDDRDPNPHAHVEADITDLDRTRWKGTWAQTAYIKNDIVLDNGYLMVANKDTEDKAGPTAVGEPFKIYEGASPTTSNVVKQVLFGTRYGPTTVPVFLTSYAIWTVVGNHYSLFSVLDPDGAASTQQVLDFTAQTAGWIELSIAPVGLAVGTLMDIVAITTELDPSPTTFNGNWNYLTQNNESLPVSGQITQGSKNAASLKISKTDDDGGDRSAALLALSTGDIIEGANTRWSIQSKSDEGTYIEFIVAPAQLGAPDGVENFVFETTAATPITMIEDPAYWATSLYSTVQGIVSIDDTYENATYNTNAYGIDIAIQQVNVSDDWDAMAATATLTGSGSSGNEGVSEAPEDGTPYSRQDALWVNTINDITAESIGDLSDVDLTGVADNKILKWATDKFIIADDSQGTDAIWGNITGTLSDQTDLQTALDGKATSAQGSLADSATQPGDNVSTLTNDAGYINTLVGIGGYTEAFTTAAAIAADTYNVHKSTLTGNIAVSFSNVPNNFYSCSFEIVSDGTSTISWPASTTWVGNNAPTIPAASQILLVTLSTSDNGTTWTGIHSESEGGISSVAWGDITGTLGDQTDLQTALDTKLESGDDISNLVNDVGYLTTNAVDSVNAQTGVVVLTKVDVGLGNVDNTSDLNKPISTATQTALDGKAASVHTHTKAQITDFDDADYATAAQGALADSALQDITAESIGDLSDVDLTGLAANKILEYNGSSFVVIDTPGGGGAAWGDITGTLSDQTDLQTELDDRTGWKGDWVAGTYDKGDQVLDEEYLMIANKTTTDKPAPVTSPLEWGQGTDTPGGDYIDSHVISCVNNYDFSSAGTVRSLRVYSAYTTNENQVIIKDKSDPANPLYTLIYEPTLAHQAWTTLTIAPINFTSSSEIEFTLLTYYNTSTNDWTGTWICQGTAENVAPPSGQWNKNADETIIHISTTPDGGGDATSDLMDRTIGGELYFQPSAYERYYIVDNPTNEGTYIKFHVVKIDSSGTITAGQSCYTELRQRQHSNQTGFNFTDPYWDSNQPNYGAVTGILRFEGVDNAALSANTAYGIDIEVEEMAMSDDWDIQQVPVEAGMSDAPVDGTSYSRKDAGWVSTINTVQDDTSPRLGGQLTCEGNSIQQVGELGVNGDGGTPYIYLSYSAPSHTPAVIIQGAPGNVLELKYNQSSNIATLQANASTNDNIVLTCGSNGVVQIQRLGGYSEATTTSSSINAATHNFTTIGNSTVAFSNIPAGAYTCTIICTGDTYTWPSGIKWQGATAPTLTTDDDMVILTTTDQGSNWYGSYNTGFA